MIDWCAEVDALPEVPAYALPPTGSRRAVRAVGRWEQGWLAREAALHREAGHHLPWWRRALLRMAGG